MLEFLRLFSSLVRDVFRKRLALEVEIVLLQHQLGVLRRNAPKRTQLTSVDRFIFAFFYNLNPEMVRSLCIVQPETLIRWYRFGFKALWRWKSRRRGGRPTVPKDIRNLIREMSVANPLWGAPRIHGELKMLGINIAQSTVAKYMIKRRGPPSQNWKTFLHNHTDSIASTDFLVVPTISFKLLYVFVVLGHARSKILHIAITAHPTAQWTAQKIIKAFPWDDAPTHLIRDNDSIFSAAFKK